LTHSDIIAAGYLNTEIFFEASLEIFSSVSYGTSPNTFDSLGNSFGTHLEFIWNSFGTHLELTWNSLGTHLERIWNAFETHLERIWNSFGTHLKLI
jgi:hypothetical protein